MLLRGEVQQLQQSDGGHGEDEAEVVDVEPIEQSAVQRDREDGNQQVARGEGTDLGRRKTVGVEPVGGEGDLETA